jgi:hypothetical protein
VFHPGLKHVATSIKSTNDFVREFDDGFLRRFLLRKQASADWRGCARSGNWASSARTCAFGAKLPLSFANFGIPLLSFGEAPKLDRVSRKERIHDCDRFSPAAKRRTGSAEGIHSFGTAHRSHPRCRALSLRRDLPPTMASASLLWSLKTRQVTMHGRLIPSTWPKRSSDEARSSASIESRSAKSKRPCKSRKSVGTSHWDIIF